MGRLLEQSDMQATAIERSGKSAVQAVARKRTRPRPDNTRGKLGQRTSKQRPRRERADDQ